MANERFFLEGFNFGEVQDAFNSTHKSSDSKEGERKQEKIRFDGADEEWGRSWNSDPLSSIMSPPLKTCLEEISKFRENENGIGDLLEPNKEKQLPLSLASFELLKKYGNGLKRLNDERQIEPNGDPPSPMVVKQELSTEEIMRIAGARFIHSSSADVHSNHPFDLSFSSLSGYETKNVELSELLLSAAEKVGNQQFDSASRLLDLCDFFSSNTGNPVQRLVYYFSGALRERINQETGRATSKGFGKEQSFNICEAIMAPSLSNMTFYKQNPFNQVSQFAGIQAIVENVTEAKRIHIIDLEIRSGLHWTIFMQALVSREAWPLELLKITAIGTTSKQLIEDTGKRLMSFAQTMNLPFSFNVVMVSDMLDLREDDFQLDDEETVAVFSEFYLARLIASPNRLDSLTKVIRNINPRVMVIIEVEANHNSPVFVDRFIETLFYLSAFFDCLDTCMERDDPNRMISESLYFGEGIRKILVAEGDERNIRNVKIDVWRACFARFDMVEAEMSISSTYQANIMAKKLACGKACTLNMDGKSLIIGWKGTPIHSLSVWKFA
ncbi:unnamed protein product [Dovyalis caffra]|uniref:DELLA RGL1-like protein n=1 Tax=Dovyalis caffra TaxID=77055 RepID=A0AAV1QZ16_9ROSI|nr:unnamed protein product [Dovyalis caffra]